MYIILEDVDLENFFRRNLLRCNIDVTQSKGQRLDITQTRSNDFKVNKP